MSENYFARIAHERSLQKEIMDQLEVENHKLRKLLADLRAGKGIAVTILGTRLSLKDNATFLLTTAM